MHYNYNEIRDVEMKFKPYMTDDATAKFVFIAKNNSQELRTVSGTFTAMATYYTGATADELRESKDKFKLKAGEGNIRLLISPYIIEITMFIYYY